MRADIQPDNAAALARLRENGNRLNGVMIPANVLVNMILRDYFRRCEGSSQSDSTSEAHDFVQDAIPVDEQTQNTPRIRDNGSQK